MKLLDVLQVPLALVWLTACNAAELNETSGALAPQARWERFIAPAPTIVSLLGSLMVISTKADFSLERSMPIGGFQHISNPSSFRATLVQISNDGWAAFNEAHTNMDKIQLYMEQVPRRVKSALRMIDRGNIKQIKRLLPVPLKHIGSMANKSAELALQTHDKFAEVMDLLGEVILVTTNEKSIHTQDLNNLQLELNVSRQMSVDMKAYGKTLKTRVDKLEKDVERYQKDYEDAMDDIPTGWNAIFKGLGHATIGIVKNFGNMFLGGGGGGGGGSSGAAPAADEIDGNAARAFIGGTMIRFTNELEFMYKKLGSIFSSGRITNNNSPSGMFKSYKKALQALKRQISEPGSGQADAIRQIANNALGEGIELCGDVVNAFSDPRSFPTNSTGDEIKMKIKSILKQVKPLSTTSVSTGTTGGGATGSTVPGAGNPDDNFYNERFKASNALSILQSAQDRSDRMFKEYLEFQEKTTKLMAKITRLNFQEINFKKILEIMREGIAILTEIRRQWSKLVLFFSTIAVRSEVTLKTTLEPFLMYTKDFHELDSISDEDRNFYLDLLVDEAKDINGIAYFLHIVSKTYVEISEKYIITALAGLPSLLSAETDGKRQEMLMKLEQESRAATTHIERMAREQRELFNAQVKAQIEDATSKLKHYDDLEAGL